MPKILFVEIRKQLESRWRPNWCQGAFAKLHVGFREAIQATTKMLELNQSLKEQGRLSSAGLREEMRNFAQDSTVPILHRAAITIESSKEYRDQKRLSLTPKADSKDVVAALLRIEMRSWLRNMDAGEQMTRLLSPQVSQDLLLAALEVPPEMAGLTSQMRDQIQNHLLAHQHGAELGHLDELTEAISTTAAALDVALMELRSAIGFDDNQSVAFDEWMKTVTAKIKSEQRAKQSIETENDSQLSPDGFEASISSKMDEIWARAFPQLYPDHPVNRTG
jgi:hypothetical protein